MSLKTEKYRIVKALAISTIAGLAGLAIAYYIIARQTYEEQFPQLIK